jgi:hypothetical protein
LGTAKIDAGRMTEAGFALTKPARGHHAHRPGFRMTVTKLTDINITLASSSANSLISLLWRISSFDVASSASASDRRQWASFC